MRNTVSIIVMLVFAASAAVRAQALDISIKQDAAAERVDVIISGSPFTSFCYPKASEKPYLFPVYAPGGAVVTRGYPLAPRKGERIDHPHHTGLWFNHGDVNGLDFWNNSSAVKDKTKYGHIAVTKILKAEGGKKGEIAYVAEWRDCKDNTLLEEQTTFYITADAQSRTIDRVTIIKALAKEVVFTDNKEGMIAIRVDRAFETPTDAPQLFTDEHGNPTEVKATGDNTGVNGMYYSGGGQKGDDVWSTRNNWVMLRGEKEGKPVTFGFFDHPANPGYPFHSHARGYGLFACNNLGSQAYNKDDPKITAGISPGGSLTFHHRFYITEGAEVSPEQADSIFRGFSNLY